MARKAHGTAAEKSSMLGTEPRLAGLLQTVPSMLDFSAKAVLEQPSLRTMHWQKLGRRNIVLSQSDELNQLREQAKHKRDERRTQPLANTSAVLYPH